MAEHTPGPWDFEPDAAGPPTLGFLKVFHAGTRQHVASRVRPEDAALVAAAPDLLVTAQLTLAALNVAIDNCTWKLGLHLVAAEQAAAQMRAAIARARGG